MTQTPKHTTKKTTQETDEKDSLKDIFILKDKDIREVFPADDEIELDKKPMTEAEVEEEVGGDMPVEDIANMNEEDEEEEKGVDIV